MSEVRQPTARAIAALQALAAAGTYALTFVAGFQLAGIGLLLFMAVVWPPRVAWLPVRAKRVLCAYGPFALVWLAIAIGYLYAMHSAGAPVSPQPQLEQLAREGFGTKNAGMIIFVIVVMAPVWEEILFRGYLFTALDGYLPRIGTHLLTAGLFGLVHGYHYAFPIGVLALLFGWLRARYNALAPSMLAHAVHNALTVSLVIAWPDLLDLMYPK